MPESNAPTQTLQGIPAAPGLAHGEMFLLNRVKLQIPDRPPETPEVEWSKLLEAIEQARTEIVALEERVRTEVGEEEAGVFGAHQMFLDDPDLQEDAQEKIENGGMIAEAAWKSTVDFYAAKLEALPDKTLSERAADVRDVGQRVLAHMLGVGGQAIAQPSRPVIIVADDLAPSETASLDKKFVLAFCTAQGGPTSHTAILAKTLGLPAVVGLGQKILDQPPATRLLVNGNSGQVIVGADTAMIEAFEQSQREAAEQSKSELALAHQPAVTTDGKAVEVVANIGQLSEAAHALEMGAEGVGLLRTEFLYLDRDVAPDEEEQFRVYQDILDVMGERPVVVRTLDVGGDKPPSYMDLGQEENPFLGWRAIRISLDLPDFFKEQLRALLRASPSHDLRIMFPMIATLEDIRRAKEILTEVRADLEERGIPTAARVQVGIMVEVPSTAVIADIFAKEVDFFSIGTNDLTQYTFAADRGNVKVARYGDSIHPAVLRLIAEVIRAGHAAGIWVGLCGELAGDTHAIPVLLGLGLDEFSMAANSIPHAKAVIRRWNVEQARKVAEKALQMDTAAAVRTLVNEFILE